MNTIIDDDDDIYLNYIRSLLNNYQREILSFAEEFVKERIPFESPTQTIKIKSTTPVTFMYFVFGVVLEYEYWLNRHEDSPSRRE